MSQSHWLRIVLTGLAIFALPVAAAWGGGQIYKWVDEHGKVHYSDCPPQQESQVEEVQIDPRPSDEEIAKARERLDTLLAEQKISAADRRVAREAKKQAREEALAKAVQMKRECAMSRQNLHVLQKPRPVYHIDDTGEYIYFSDEERAAEIARLEAFISDHCSGD